jgi:hypothetical protein
MPSDITSSNVTATIPALGDSANVVAAFTDYHTDIASAIDAKSNTSGQAFTGAISSTGTITSSATSANTAINLVGQASSAIKGAIWYGTTTSGFNVNTTSIGQTRKIIVSTNEPATANLQIGDIWIDY